MSADGFGEATPHVGERCPFPLGAEVELRAMSVSGQVITGRFVIDEMLQRSPSWTSRPPVEGEPRILSYRLRLAFKALDRLRAIVERRADYTPNVEP